MTLDYETLKLIWWLLIGILLIGFAIADGMDMGVGMLLPFVADSDSERRVVINTVGPHWDGNQVWLVTAGGALFAAWPIVYAAAFSGFYVAMLLTLFALFFRPLGFDYRSKIDDSRWRNAWDWALFAGSAIPALIFGVAFGNLLLGVPLEIDTLLRTSYHGGFFGLLNPFALLAGVVSLAMLVLHGAVWLQMRSGEPVATRARTVVGWAGLALMLSFALAGVWLYYGIDGFRIVSIDPLNGIVSPLAKEVVMEPGAWLANYQQWPWMQAAPATVFGGALLAMGLSRLGWAGPAFFASAAAITGVILTAGFAMFPFVMPSNFNPNHSLTLWDAVSSELTLTIMLVAVVIFLPIILAYTLWGYWRMWGRVTVEHIEANSHSSY